MSFAEHKDRDGNYRSFYIVERFNSTGKWSPAEGHWNCVQDADRHIDHLLECTTAVDKCRVVKVSPQSDDTAAMGYYRPVTRSGPYYRIQRIRDPLSTAETESAAKLLNSGWEPFSTIMINDTIFIYLRKLVTGHQS